MVLKKEGCKDERKGKMETEGQDERMDGWIDAWMNRQNS